MSFQLDQTDRSLVNLMQMGFPLVREPFAQLGLKLGLNEQEVLQRVVDLRKKQIIRILGPVFNSRALGYQSTLVAMRVSEEKVEPAARVINQHPGVGHNYQRAHEYNLWFTLAIRGDRDLTEALQQLEEKIHPKSMFELPASKLFKIRLFFDVEGNGSKSEETIVPQPQPEQVMLSEFERDVINAVQGQLPLISRPFDDIARSIGQDVYQFLTICNDLQQRGIMRRLGASIEHQNVGFVANSMVCWEVPQEVIDEVGMKMAAFKEVTHCYERKTNPLWPKYNVFTMIHGNTFKENEDTIALMESQTGIIKHESLNTIKEFKKERVRYRV